MFGKIFSVIDDRDHQILRVASSLQIIQASDVTDAMRNPPHNTTVSRWLKSLRDRKMLIPESKNSNKYHLNFVGNALMRFMIQALEKEGYVPFNE